MRNRVWIGLFALVVSGGGCAVAQSATPSPSTNQTATADATTISLSADSSLDQILDALDRSGQNLSTLTADVKLTETDAALGDATTRTGKVWLENRADGSTRFHALFDRKEENGQTRIDKIEYLLQNGKLTDRNYAKKTQVTRIVLKPGEKVNLLKLGEGPFPLPIGQKREDVYKSFDAKKADAKSDDPAGTVHVLLNPKSDTSLSRKMKSIDVWVGIHDQLPQRIETVDPNETTIRRTDLINLKINGQVEDTDFKMENVDDKSWNKIDESFQN